MALSTVLASFQRAKGNFQRSLTHRKIDRQRLGFSSKPSFLLFNFLFTFHPSPSSNSPRHDRHRSSRTIPPNRILRRRSLLPLRRTSLLRRLLQLLQLTNNVLQTPNPSLPPPHHRNQPHPPLYKRRNAWIWRNIRP